MRTVDPELWTRKVKKPAFLRARFGQHPGGTVETRLRQSLWDALQEFWHNSSVASAKYINLKRIHQYERYTHIAVFIASYLVGAVVIMLNLQFLDARPPLIVTLKFEDNAITKTPFPAIALCSNYVIRKTALKNYTRYLYRHPKNRIYGFPESDIYDNLQNLGALLTLAAPPFKEDFENFFLAVDTNHNITDIMFKLSANCSAILKRCSWRGRLTDCDNLFASRLTALGFCCVFNSRYQPVDVGREAAVLDVVGQNFGLGFAVREDRDEVAYVRRPAKGMDMILFGGDEYPLIEGGNAHVYPVPRNTSLFFKVRSFLQYPTHDLRFYEEERRQCSLTGRGMSQCLAECRGDTAHALCGCVPYVLQPQGAPALRVTCSLADLPCLNKHREKFMYIYPGNDEEPTLRQEQQDALDCPDCRALCRRQLFSANIFYTRFNFKSTGIYKTFLSEGLSLVNSTVVRVFYNVDHQVWHKLEADMRWYNIIVKLGTQWLIVTGVSVLCYTELAYHCTFRWLHHFIRRSRIANMQPVATPTR